MLLIISGLLILVASWASGFYVDKYTQIQLWPSEWWFWGFITGAVFVGFMIAGIKQII